MTDSQPTPTPEVDAPKTSESKPKPILRSKEEREKAPESGRQPNRDKPKVGGKSEGRSSEGRSEGRSNDKRRGRQDQPEAPGRSNPALARGPKPMIAKPAPEPEPEVEETTTENEATVDKAASDVSEVVEAEVSTPEAE
jgi:hypothetical protein